MPDRVPAGMSYERDGVTVHVLTDTELRNMKARRKVGFMLTCPNEQCEAAIPDDGETDRCPVCGCYLFMVRPVDQRETARTSPATLER